MLGKRSQTTVVNSYQGLPTAKRWLMSIRWQPVSLQLLWKVTPKRPVSASLHKKFPQSTKNFLQLKLIGLGASFQGIAHQKPIWQGKIEVMSNFLKDWSYRWGELLHSTEVTFLLLTQQPWVQFSAFSRIFFRCCRYLLTALLRAVDRGLIMSIKPI